jgi:hypothetical protein
VPSSAVAQRDQRQRQRFALEREREIGGDIGRRSRAIVFVILRVQGGG